MKRRIEEVKKIVIKVGSSSLCDKDGKINKEKILMLTWQIAKLKKRRLYRCSSLFRSHCSGYGRIRTRQ